MRIVCFILFLILLNCLACGGPGSEPKAVSTGRAPVPKSRAAADLAPVKIEDGYPKSIVDQLHVLTLLRESRFEELEALLKSYQSLFEEDFHNEYFVEDAFASLAVRDLSLEEKFKEWLVQIPDSWAAYSGRAKYYFARGSEARGQKFISETPKSNLEAMESYHDLALRDAERAIKLNPAHLTPYGVLIDIAKHRGDIEIARKILDKATEQCPYCFIPRTTFIFLLTPRWGGSYKMMQEYCGSLAPLKAKNPRLRLLDGYMYLDQAWTAGLNGDKPAALDLYARALAEGEHWLFYHQRGKLYARMKQWDKALSDYDRALELRPGMAEVLNSRAIANYYLNHQAQAIEDISLAYQLEPDDEDIIKARKVILRIQE